MARYRFKAFDPKAGEPGAPIEWRHTGLDGQDVTRTGVVWSLAPGPGRWVSPDSSLPGDLYGLIYVTPAGAGRWHSSDHPTSTTGKYTAHAAHAAAQHRVNRRAA